jgi:hypothetical protein
LLALFRDFLAGNCLNAFFYDEQPGRGIASVIDHALAVGRPLAVTRSSMFRHITAVLPEVCVTEHRLAAIMARGEAPLVPWRNEWCAANLVWDYERLVAAALAAPRRSWRQVLGERLGSRRRRHAVDWTPNTAGAVVDGGRTAADPYVAPAVDQLRCNRVLDDDARRLYQPAITYLETRLPAMMQRKIKAANVQQAFVLDTVVRLAATRTQPAILCIGSFDDTAAAGLRRCGLALDEIDPVVNYDLATYLTKPTCRRAGYDIVFATSVLEHVRDDELFVCNVASLLRDGGVAVLTCDFDDSYRPGDPHPPEDFRLYTRRDFLQRLLPLVPDLELVDEPRWECAEPDFTYGGVRYTFATLVLRRRPAGVVGGARPRVLAAAGG